MRRDRARSARDGADSLASSNHLTPRPRARELVVQLLGRILGDFGTTGRQVDKVRARVPAERAEKMLSFRVQQMGVKVRAGPCVTS